MHRPFQIVFLDYNKIRTHVLYFFVWGIYMTFIVSRSLLPEIRAAKGWTQQELGDLVGMSRHEISDYEHLRKIMSYETAYNISEVTGTPMKELYKMIPGTSRNRRGRVSKKE